MHPALRMRDLGSSLRNAGWNRSLAVSLLLCLILSSAAAASGLPSGWVSLDGTTDQPCPPSLEITSSDLDELVLHIECPGFMSATVIHEKTDYSRLTFPGFYHSTVEGSPWLPALRQLIAVPADCTIGLEVALGDSILFSGSILYPVPATVVRYTEEGRRRGCSFESTTSRADG